MNDNLDFTLGDTGTVLTRELLDQFLRWEEQQAHSPVPEAYPVVLPASWLPWIERLEGFSQAGNDH